MIRTRRLLILALILCIPCHAKIQKLPKTHKIDPVIIKNSPVMRIPNLAPLPEGSWVRLHNVEVTERTDSWVTVKHPSTPETIKVYSPQKVTRGDHIAYRSSVGDHILVSGQLTKEGIATFIGDNTRKLQGYFSRMIPYQYQAGTINYALEQPDRSTVSLTTVDINRIRNLSDGSQLLTCSTNDSLPILVLLPTKLPMLKNRLTLDIEGTMVHLPNRDTVIVNPKVTGYQFKDKTDLVSVFPVPSMIDNDSRDNYTKVLLCTPSVDYTIPTSFDPEVKIVWITPVSYTSIAMLLADKPTTGTYVELRRLQVVSLGSKPGKYMVLKDQPTVIGGKSILLYTAKTLNASSFVESVIAKVYTVSVTTVLLADNSDPRFDPQTDIGSVNVIN